MFELTVETVFSASHQLKLYDERQEPMHGHNWDVKLTIRLPQLDTIGIGCDFHTLQRGLFEVCDKLNGTHLNNRPEFTGLNPSAENVCLVIAREVQQRLGNEFRVHAVSVGEAPGCRACWIADAKAPS